MSSINAHVFMNLSSSLRSLSLAGCELQGKFPKYIFDLPNLNLLNLGGNQLIRTASKITGKPLATHSFRLEFKQIEWTNSIVNSKPNAVGILGNI
ncbi:hypothetical protein Gotur_031279 [Gossypium turneri]